MNSRERLGRWAVDLFAFVVLAWGVSGILLPRVWLEHVFAVPTNALDPTARASLLAEFRFLQARELGVGLLTVALRREIVSNRRINTIFLLVVAASPAARLLSLVIDGAPSWLSRGFLVTEALMALTLWVTTRRSAVG